MTKCTSKSCTEVGHHICSDCGKALCSDHAKGCINCGGVYCKLKCHLKCQISSDYASAWGLKSSTNLAQGAADYYLLEEMKASLINELIEDKAKAKMADDAVRTMLPPLVSNLAEQMSRYLEMAIGGELRHCKAVALGGGISASNVKKVPSSEIRELTKEIFGGKKGKLRTGSRSIAWVRWKGLSEKLGVKAAEYASWMFWNSVWNGGYGGPKWGKCADVLLLYMKGELSENLFVDSAFGLEHNNNNVYDKVFSIDSLKSVLDANLNEQPTLLMQVARPQVRDVYVKVFGIPEPIKPKKKTPGYKPYVTSKQKKKAQTPLKKSQSVAHILSPTNSCSVCKFILAKKCSKVHAFYQVSTSKWLCYQCQNVKPAVVVKLEDDKFTKLFALCPWCLTGYATHTVKLAGHVVSASTK